MINFRKQHTIQIHNPTDRKDHTQITTLKHKQIDFLTVTRNFQIRKTEQDVTEPKYFAAVVSKRNTINQYSINLGHITVNLGSDTNFVMTQNRES